MKWRGEGGGDIGEGGNNINKKQIQWSKRTRRSFARLTFRGLSPQIFMFFCLFSHLKCIRYYRQQCQLATHRCAHTHTHTRAYAHAWIEMRVESIKLNEMKTLPSARKANISMYKFAQNTQSALSKWRRARDRIRVAYVAWAKRLEWLKSKHFMSKQKCQLRCDNAGTMIQLPRQSETNETK